MFHPRPDGFDTARSAYLSRPSAAKATGLIYVADRIPSRLCQLCKVEELFSDRICHAPTSMMSLEAIRAVGHCERCGGSIDRGAGCEALQGHIASAYRDGHDSALGGEAMPDLWELIDLGYAPNEALAFQRAFRAGLTQVREHRA